MKAPTIPKLELQAALLAARLEVEVRKSTHNNCRLNVNVDRQHHCATMLHSIDEQPVFVANRVTEITVLTRVDERNHAPTVDNPAVAGTRGLSAKALSESTWLRGLAFLRTSDWPFQPLDEIMKSKLKKLYSDNLHTEPKYQETTSITTNVIFNALTLEWKEYRSYQKLLRILS